MIAIWEYIKRHDYPLLAAVVALGGIARGTALMVPQWTTSPIYDGYRHALPVWGWGLLLAGLSVGLIAFLRGGDREIGAGCAFALMVLWLWQAHQALFAGIPPGAAVLYAFAGGSLLVYVKILKGDGHGGDVARATGNDPDRSVRRDRPALGGQDGAPPNRGPRSP